MSTAALLAIGAYVALLLTMGVLGRRSMRRQSLSEFYLAGRSIGFAVLLLTLFATQYSGNSLSGFPGKTYRAGLSYFMSVTFMVGIVAGYLPFAPRLFALARRKLYLTPTDFLAIASGVRPSITFRLSSLPSLCVTSCSPSSPPWGTLSPASLPARSPIGPGSPAALW